MTDAPNKPTLPERYAAACSTSNLRVTPDRTGAGDLIIAAGWSAMGSRRIELGMLLDRLAGEFDSARAQLLQLRSNIDGTWTTIRELKKAAGAERHEGRDDKAKLMQDQAALLRAQLDATVRSELAHASNRLQSMRAARVALREYAEFSAHVQGVDVDAERVSGLALDILLDPICHLCGGRGKRGSIYNGEVERICAGQGSCKGTGLRSTWVWSGLEEAAFGRWLLVECEEMASAAKAAHRATLYRHV